MQRKPEWLKSEYDAAVIGEMNALLENLQLNTVCSEANCPNRGECWRKKTATFMILGVQCTRGCRFCNVTKGCPAPPDPGEPAHVAAAAKALGLRHVVVTSVTRDDLPDGGSAQFAAVVRALKEEIPGVTVELLIPDFQGDRGALKTVLDAKPDILAHNLETVPELYATVRPQARYLRSLEVLSAAKELSPGMITKTGIMVGLGETEEQVLSLMDDALAHGCDILTIGQYLRPSKEHLPVVEYIHPDQFEKYAQAGREKGFCYIYSAPFVRSSYHAAEAFESCMTGAAEE